MQDLTATVTYDQGQLYIYSITLTEQPHLPRGAAALFPCAVCRRGRRTAAPVCPCGERGAARRRALRLPLALAGITLLACLPLFSNHLYFGHDLNFTCSASPPWLRSCPTDSSRCG